MQGEHIYMIGFVARAILRYQTATPGCASIGYAGIESRQNTSYFEIRYVQWCLLLRVFVCNMRVCTCARAELLTLRVMATISSNTDGILSHHQRVPHSV